MLVVVTEAVVCDAVPGGGAGSPRAPAGHPLTPVLPLLRDTLVAVADEAMHAMVVTDAHGHVLWRDGHVVRTHHSWTCAACPVHDPDTDEVVGTVDVTGPARAVHPTTFALVAAVARLAETHLAVRLAIRGERVLRS